MRRKAKPQAEPRLTREEEYELVRRWKEDKDNKALVALLTAYDRLLHSVAHKWSNRNPYALHDDYMQAMKMRFGHVVGRFEPSRGHRLMTFLEPHLNSIAQVQTRRESITRPSNDGTAKRIKSYLKAEMAKHPEINTPYGPIFRAVAKKARVSFRDVESYFMGTFTAASLDAPVAHDTTATFLDFIEDTGSMSVETMVVRENVLDVLEQALGTLDERQQVILRRRHGLDESEEGKTHTSLSEEFGISTQKVRQLEINAMRDLRVFFEQNGFSKTAIAEILSL